MSDYILLIYQTRTLYFSNSCSFLFSIILVCLALKRVVRGFLVSFNVIVELGFRTLTDGGLVNDDIFAKGAGTVSMTTESERLRLPNNASRSLWIFVPLERTSVS